MKTNPTFFCDNEEKSVREFHIQNILDVFTGIKTLKIQPEDLIADFSRWDIDKIDVYVSSCEYPLIVAVIVFVPYVLVFDGIVIKYVFWLLLIVAV